MAYGRIYGIEYLVDHRIYVGQTTRKIRERIAEHKSAKKVPIDKAISKYGWENFVWVVLEECNSREELDEAERRWIERLECIYPKGFNRSNGGKTGFKCHELTRKKMSAVQLGRPVSINSRLKQSAARKKVFYPNLDAELNRQQLMYASLAKLLERPATTITAKLNGTDRLDEKTALAIREVLGVDMPLEELFKTNEGNTASDGE